MKSAFAVVLLTLTFSAYAAGPIGEYRYTSWTCSDGTPIFDINLDNQVGTVLSQTYKLKITDAEVIKIINIDGEHTFTESASYAQSGNVMETTAYNGIANWEFNGVTPTNRKPAEKFEYRVEGSKLVLRYLPPTQDSCANGSIVIFEKVN